MSGYVYGIYTQLLQLMKWSLSALQLPQITLMGGEEGRVD